MKAKTKLHKTKKTKNAGSKKKKTGELYLTEYKPFSDPLLKDPKLTCEVLWDCLLWDDRESFKEVLCSYLISTKDKKITKKLGFSLKTLTDMLKPGYDPKFSEISYVINAIAKKGNLLVPFDG